MGIDIFSIKPNVVTRDLSGKSFLIYGERKRERKKEKEREK